MSKEQVKKRTKSEKKGLIMSLFILFMMVFSIVGFAFISGGGGQGQQTSQTPKDYALQQMENQGYVYWFAIKNYQQFVFENIDGYEEDIIVKGLANQIKDKQFLNIYFDNNYENQDSVFLIQRALDGLEIGNNLIAENVCDANTMVFTYNTSLEGDCIKFTFSKEESYKKAEILTYHLIK